MYRTGKIRKKTTKKEIHLSFSVIVLLLLPFFEPDCIKYLFPFGSFVFNLCLVVAAVFVVFLYVLNGDVSRIMFAIIAFEASLATSTILNSGDILTMTKNVVKIISFCMLIEIGVRQTPKNLIRALIFVLGIECAVNSITILVFPNGMYSYIERITPEIAWGSTNNFFLGYDNMHFLYLFPFLCTALIYAGHRKVRKGIQIIMVMLFCATVYVTWSVASVISITIFIFLFLAYEFHMPTKLLKWRNYLLIIFAGFLGLVVFRVQNLFEGFIVGVMRKDITLTGRTYVWDKALHYFSQKPLLGGGRLSRTQNYLIYGLSHQHDMFLRILCESGIVGFICFLVILLSIGKSLKKSSQNRDRFLLSLTLFCFLIVFLTEAFDDLTSMFGLFIMAYHIRSLTEGLDKPEAEETRFRLVFGRRNQMSRFEIVDKMHRA